MHARFLYFIFRSSVRDAVGATLLIFAGDALVRVAIHFLLFPFVSISIVDRCIRTVSEHPIADRYYTVLCRHRESYMHLICCDFSLQFVLISGKSFIISTLIRTFFVGEIVNKQFSFLVRMQEGATNAASDYDWRMI